LSSHWLYKKLIDCKTISTTIAKTRPASQRGGGRPSAGQGWLLFRVAPAQFDGQDEGRFFFILAVFRAKAQLQFFFLDQFQVSDQNRGQDEHGQQRRKGTGQDCHPGIGQDGSQRHRVAAVFERANHQQPLGRQHGEGRSRGQADLNDDGPDGDETANGDGRDANDDVAQPVEK